MGFIDKIRAYLNEDEPEVDDITEAGDEKKPNNSSRKRQGLRLFRRNKRHNIEAGAENMTDEINSDNASFGDSETIRDFCEQLIDVSYHMEDMKREYKVVTEYLTDIQRIEELPINIVNEITDVARKIDMLDKNRQMYLQSENLLSLDQYNMIASVEKEIPDTVKNLNDMEMRDAMLKSDMGHLEGEKEDLKFMRNEYSDNVVRIRGVLVTILVIFLITSIVLLSIAMATRKSVTLFALAVGVAAVLSFVVAYVRYLDLKSEIRESDAKVKRAVSLLNKVKVKYINNKNALDYIYDKYGVNSCKELEYKWEQYNTMVRDARKYSQANSDLRVYSDELVEKLAKLGLHDPSVWPKQVNAIIDRREMVEIKHGLNVRRQKIREKLGICERIRDNAKAALRAEIMINPGIEKYITELLTSYHLKFED